MATVVLHINRVTMETITSSERETAVWLMFK